MLTALRLGILLSWWLVTLPSVWAGGMVLDGRVHEVTGQRGIPALAVKLIPPRDRRGVERVTSTDEGGRFHFDNLDGGRYLLEVYQGVMLLYREVINLDRDMRKDIELRRRQ